MRVVEFGSLFQFIRNGMSVKQDKSGDGLPITRIETIADATIDAKRVGYAGVNEEDGRRWLLEPGDILFSHINSVEHVGKCALYRGVPEKLVHGMNLLCMRCDQTQLLPEFATYLVRSPVFRARLQNFINKAVNQASVSIGNLKPIPVSIPTLAEQRRIAAILDQADALRVKRREALTQLDSLTQSIFIEMFGDPVSNPKGWPTAALGAHVSKLGSGSTPTGGDASYKESGISLIRSLNVHDGEFTYKNLAFIDAVQAEKLSSVVVAEGDVLLNITGASVARVCAVPSNVLPARVNQHVMIVRPKPTLNRLFLERLLLSPQMKTKLLQIGGAGATREAITKAQAEELVIPIPPISIQNEFAARVSKAQEIRTSNLQSLRAMDTLFASLQHRAFRGEL